MTPREPDRFDAQARELWNTTRNRYEAQGVEAIAAALRAAAFSPLGDNHRNAAACPHCGDLLSKAKIAAESSALERAAQALERRDHIHASKIVRALIPPAAAPAAETGKAQGADKIGYCKTCGLDASHGVCNDPRDALLRECEEAMRVRQHDGMSPGTIRELLAKLAARVAPADREGK